MKRILIIEDDETIAAIERDYLVRSDFAVDIAATGGEGLALGRTGKYDLILLDLMLPGLSGEALLPKLAGSPVIVISADTPDCTKRALRQHISNLRRKLASHIGRDCIEAVWGIGLRLKL